MSLNTDPAITKALSLMKGQRQTLVIPSEPTLMYLVSTHASAASLSRSDAVTGLIFFSQNEDSMSKPEEGKNAVRSVDVRVDSIFS